MSTIKKLSDRFHYYFDSIKVTALRVKIEHFILSSTNEHLIVVYRLGRQKLFNKMSLKQFEREYFEKVSNYDQHRLTKFSTLENTLQRFFNNNNCNKETFTRFIQEHVKNDQLL